MLVGDRSLPRYHQDKSLHSYYPWQKKQLILESHCAQTWLAPTHQLHARRRKKQSCQQQEGSNHSTSADAAAQSKHAALTLRLGPETALHNIFMSYILQELRGKCDSATGPLSHKRQQSRPPQVSHRPPPTTNHAVQRAAADVTPGSAHHREFI